MVLLNRHCYFHHTVTIITVLWTPGVPAYLLTPVCFNRHGLFGAAVQGGARCNALGILLGDFHKMV